MKKFRYRLGKKSATMYRVTNRKANMGKRYVMKVEKEKPNIKAPTRKSDLMRIVREQAAKYRKTLEILAQ